MYHRERTPEDTLCLRPDGKIISLTNLPLYEPTFQDFARRMGAHDLWDRTTTDLSSPENELSKEAWRGTFRVTSRKGRHIFSLGTEHPSPPKSEGYLRLNWAVSGELDAWLARNPVWEELEGETNAKGERMFVRPSTNSDKGTWDDRISDYRVLVIPLDP